MTPGKRTVALFLLALLAAGCGRELPFQEEQEEPPMKVQSMDVTVHQVHQRALAVADHLDVPLRNPRRSRTPCSDPSGDHSTTGVYYMSARQQLRVGEDRMTEAIETMHTYFTERGFDVSDIRWSPDGSGGGQLRATDPGGFDYSMRPTVNRDGYAFSVYSPCLQAPEGEDPVDGRWFPPADMVWDGESPDDEDE